MNQHGDCERRPSGKNLSSSEKDSDSVAVDEKRVSDLSEAEIEDWYRSNLHAPAWESIPLEHCPDGEKLWAAATHQLSGNEMREVIDHAAECPVCAGDLYVAREVAGEAGAIPSVDAPLRPSVRERLEVVRWRFEDLFDRLWNLPNKWIDTFLKAVSDFLERLRGIMPREAVPVATALALVVASVWLQFTPRSLSHQWEDSIQAPRGLASSAPEFIGQEERRISRENFSLSWRGPDDARYTLLLLTEEYDLLAERKNLTIRGVDLEREVFEGTPPGTVLLCVLEADLVDGSELRSKNHRVILE